MNNSEFMTPKEVATLLGVHPASVRRWIKTGQLKAIQVKCGGKIFVRKCEINRLIKPICV